MAGIFKGGVEAAGECWIWKGIVGSYEFKGKIAGAFRRSGSVGVNEVSENGTLREYSATNDTSAMGAPKSGPHSRAL